MNEDMKAAWLEISQMLGEPTKEELDVFLRTWQRAVQATREALAEQPAQQQEPWVGLTDEEMREIYKRTDWDMAGGWEYERAIESKLKEKNT